MINFPPNPIVGQQFVNIDGTVYRWDGIAWSVVVMNPTNPTVTQTASEGPDFPNNPTIGQEYMYAGNTWLWDGVAWVLKQATSIVEWDDIENKPTQYPPEPHTHVEADITDLDKYTKAEVDNSQAFQDVRLDTLDGEQDAQDNRMTNIEAVNTTQDGRLNQIDIDQAAQDAAIGNNTTKNTEQDGRLGAIEAEQIVQNTDITKNADNILVRMRWRDEWANNVTYEENDTVRDGAYLVIANNQSLNDKPVTEQEAAYPGENANTVPQTPVSEQVYWTGQEYFIQTATYVDGFRFYTPAGNFEFTVIYRVRNEDGTLQKVKQASAWQTYVTDGWKELALPSFLVLDGQRIEVWLGTRAVAAANTFSSTWDLKWDNSNPSTGEANFYSSGTELRVANEDGNGVNQYTQLQTIQPGGQISFGGDTWDVIAISNSGGTGGGGRHIFTLQPNQGRPEENEYTFQWSWGATDPLPYVADTTFWQNNQNIRGSVGTEIADDMTETDAQYGVDLLKRDVQVSANWDIMAVSGVSGGGGSPSDPGGGARSEAFHDPTNAGSWKIDYETKTLECWGRAGTSAGSGIVTVTYPKTFKRIPSLQVSVDNNGSLTVGVLYQADTENDFVVYTYNVSTVGAISRPITWYAIGEWDGVS